MQELSDIITVIEANYSTPKNSADTTINSSAKDPKYINKTLLVN